MISCETYLDGIAVLLSVVLNRVVLDWLPQESICYLTHIWGGENRKKTYIQTAEIHGVVVGST